MYKFSLIFVLLPFLLSCKSDASMTNDTLIEEQSYSGDENFEEDLDAIIPKTTEQKTTVAKKLRKGRKIIKTGSMQFDVTSLDTAKTVVNNILRSCEGYYENEQYHSHYHSNSYSLSLRVPNAKYDSLILTLENNIDKLTSKNVSAKDVTEEFVDLNIRLNNNLASLDQYKTILKKATSIEDILRVQEKIRRIAEEIESKKGRLRYLDDRANYSSLDLVLTELITTEIASSPNFAIRIGNAFNTGAQGLLTVVIGMVSIWPFLILLLLIGIFINRYPKMSRR